MEINHQDIIKSIDSLIFEHTGNHLDNLQGLILKSALSGKKYSEIADIYKCTEGHVKDEAYELWQKLSEILGENVYKSNFCSTVERLGVVNQNSAMITIENINFGGDFQEKSNIEREGESKKASQNSDLSESHLELIETRIKQQMIPKLKKIGLSVDDISIVLGISKSEIENT